MPKLESLHRAKSGRLYYHYHNLIQVYKQDLDQVEEELLFTIRTPTFEEAKAIMNDLAQREE